MSCFEFLEESGLAPSEVVLDSVDLRFEKHVLPRLSACYYLVPRI